MHRLRSPLTAFAACHIPGRTGSEPSPRQQTYQPHRNHLPPLPPGQRRQLRTVDASPGDQPGAQP